MLSETDDDRQRGFGGRGEKEERGRVRGREAGKKEKRVERETLGKGEIVNE